MHLVFTFGPGGMEHGVVKIVNGVDPARVASAICSTTPADAGMRALVAPRVRIVELNRRRHGNDPRIVAAIYRALRRERPDILHTHSWGTLLEGIVAGRMAGVPAIVHGEHGTLQLQPRQIKAQRWAWQHADELLSVSSRLAERMSRDVGIPLDRVRVIRNGVDLSRFAAARADSGRRALGLRDDGRIVLGAVGRLVDVKNHALFIDAVHTLISRGCPVVGVIAGEGPLRNDLENQIAKLGLGDAVRLAGHRPHIESTLAAFDIFVHPSRSEGMSNTILEAMASGLPVVATRVGGADELVVDGETGTLVREGDGGELCDALERLVRDTPRRRAMGAAARQRAQAEFSLETMIKGYQSFYCDTYARVTSRSAKDAREEPLSV
jgi:sugar transferase (PEP-CTERM/EpsH1 system associated)